MGRRPPLLPLACLAMRTRFELVIADAGDDARARAAGESAFAEVAEAERLLSAYRDDAELFRVNARAASGAVPVDARLFALLRRAMELCEATDGSFDLTLGALLAVWNHAGMAAGGEQAVPAASRIGEALANCGMRRLLQLDHGAGSVRFAATGLRLDAGAIGKGYALEQAGMVLREQGIASALMHGGTSTVLALGGDAAGQPWKVAIRDPADAQGVIATAALTGTSLSVSGVHGRSFIAGGRRYGHVIDPRTGWPVQGNLLAAVIDESATVSDAWSTALLVLGREGFAMLRAHHPAAECLLVREDADGRTAVEHRGDRFALAGAGSATGTGRGSAR
jgi:thiamine biosynthesis lipoprotein